MEAVEERPAVFTAAAPPADPVLESTASAVAEHRQGIPVDAVDHGLDVEAVDRVWAVTGCLMSTSSSLSLARTRWR